MPLRPWPRVPSARAASLLAAGVAAALAAAALTRPARQREPDTVSEFLECLRAAGLRWHVTAANQRGGPEDGAYLCDRPRRWEELQLLGHWPGQAPPWRGVVLVDRHPLAPLDGGRGEDGLVVGRLSLYGDRDMLKQILAALGR